MICELGQALVRPGLSLCGMCPALRRPLTCCACYVFALKLNSTSCWERGQGHFQSMMRHSTSWGCDLDV